MHIVIMGCGRVGAMLARGLEKRGHSVAVIDVDVDAFRRLGNDFHGTTVKGVGFDRQVLEEAGIRRADAFAAVYERLGIPTVATVRWTVMQVLRRLLPEGSEPVWRDPTGDARLLQVHVHSGWVGRKIRDLSRAADAPIPFVLRVGRGIVPDRETIYQDGDLLYVACMTDRTDEIETLFANPPEKQ